MNTPVNDPIATDGKVHILDYVIILAKRSRMIVGVSAAAAVLTYLYLFFSPNLYKATARLLPPQQNLTMSAQVIESLGARVSPGGGPGQTAGLGGMAANLLGLRSPGDLYVAMMTCEPVLNNIIDRFQLIKLFKAKLLVDAQEELSKCTKIASGKKDNIITVEVTWKDPKLSAAMANAYIEELDRLLQDLALQEAKGRLAFLEKERLQASQNLTKAEELVRQFSEQHGVLQIETQTRGAIEYIARLRAEIDAKEVQIQVLRYEATPRNSAMIRLETEIKGLKERLHNAESQLENCMGEVCLPTSKTPALGLEYVRLFREQKFQESLYQLYSRMVEVARLDMVRDVAVTQVLAPATPPEKRANKRLKPAMVAGILTFFAMIAMALGQEYWQNLNKKGDEAHRLKILKGYLTPWADMLGRIKNILLFRRKL